MSFSTILLLILTISIAICAYVFSALNTNIVQIDLLIRQYDIELGKLILLTFLVSMIVTLFLESIFFFSRNREKDD
tara:strand:- start:12207 stop:12434 length:228 start_codon:yes stop_codon:yes gene_type:complete